MFRRLWSGLPDAPEFPETLEELGYFVNADDEIRSIADPKYYFKYFLNKNTYWNDRQRFAFNTAVQNVVLDRLAALGLEAVRLPRGARPDEPHVRVLATADLATAARVVVFVGETAQDLGILAHRVVGGPGGVAQGSLVSMVQHLRQPNNAHEDPPAILVANPGELFWWPDGRRTLSLLARQGLPRPSAAHAPPRTVPGQNVVPGHATPEEHIHRVFEFLSECVEGGPSNNESAAARHHPRLTLIALAGGADALAAFLDHPARWARWGPQLDSLALLGGLYEAQDVQTAGYRHFLRTRARAYIHSPADAGVAVDTPLAGPDGNDRMARVACYGCPVHSAGPSWLTERLFVDAQAAVLAWGEAVARDRAYANPTIDVTYAEAVAAGNDANWADYDGETEVGWGEDEKDEKKGMVKADTVNEASGEKMAETTNDSETAKSGQEDTEGQAAFNGIVGDEVEAVGGQLATTSIHQG